MAEDLQEPATEADHEDDLPAERSERADIFRERLNGILFKRKISRAEFAAAVGLNRTSASQLLSGASSRLPRVETIAQIARNLDVSVDWLLGLSDEINEGANLPSTTGQRYGRFRFSSIRNEHFVRWSNDHSGVKTRYLPLWVPDALKNEEMIEWQYRKNPEVSVAEAIEAVRLRRVYLARPGSDTEICTSVETVTAFARGEYFYADIPYDARQRALRYMVDLYEQFYPTLRWFCFEARDNYFSGFPITIFGRKQCMIYLGPEFIALDDPEDVGEMIRQFDGLVRKAKLQPLETLELLRSLCE